MITIIKRYYKEREKKNVEPRGEGNGIVRFERRNRGGNGEKERGVYNRVVSDLYFNRLLGRTINCSIIDTINNVMRILTVNSTSNRLCGSEDLLHDSGELSGHSTGPHGAGGEDDVVHGNVSTVLDVLDLIPWRLLQGLNDQFGGRGNHRASGSPVLDL